MKVKEKIVIQRKCAFTVFTLTRVIFDKLQGKRWVVLNEKSRNAINKLVRKVKLRKRNLHVGHRIVRRVRIVQNALYKNVA